MRVSNPMSRRSTPTPGSQLGLTGMSERIGLAGGWLEVGQRGDQFVVDVGDQATGAADHVEDVGPVRRVADGQ